MKSAILAASLLLAYCGRVSDPRPPIVRIPQKIENLAAAQNGYTVVLSWTNPAKYVDKNPVTDTGAVHVFRNAVEIGTVAATPAGQPQSFSVDVRNSVGAMLTFTIQMVVPKAKKPSPVSNAVPIQVVDVPGSPRNPQYTVDKGRISLSWEPPASHPELVENYVVQRSDKPAPSVVRLPHVEDEYESGKTYTYTVTAVRGTSPQIAGDGNAKTTVVAEDKIPPVTPTGLVIQLLGNVAFLIWDKNPEPDLKGYKLFRSDRPDAIFTGTENGYTDLEYIPGKGISYQVLAEDVSGNPSLRSAPTPGP